MNICNLTDICSPQNLGSCNLGTFGTISLCMVQVVVFKQCYFRVDKVEVHHIVIDSKKAFSFAAFYIYFFFCCNLG